MHSVAHLEPVIRAPARRKLSKTARASQEAYHRRLRFELLFMKGQRDAKARGCAVREVSLLGYPAALELVRGIASRVAAGGRIPASGIMIYRGFRVRVSQSSFGRIFVSSMDGEPIGSSGFGAAWV